MDNSYPYIASLTREPFLFYEMRSTAKLMAEGNSDDTIVKEIVEQNLFQYPTEKSITRMATGFCDCITADGCGKTDLSVCIDEAKPFGLGIYADSHWREVQIKGHVFW